MKKQLLFVAAMFAAVCANAQGTWHAVGDADVCEVSHKDDGGTTIIDTQGTVKSPAGEYTVVGAEDVKKAKIVLIDGASKGLLIERCKKFVK